MNVIVLLMETSRSKTETPTNTSPQNITMYYRKSFAVFSTSFKINCQLVFTSGFRVNIENERFTFVCSSCRHVVVMIARRPQKYELKCVMHACNTIIFPLLTTDIDRFVTLLLLLPSSFLHAFMVQLFLKCLSFRHFHNAVECLFCLSYLSLCISSFRMFLIFIVFFESSCPAQRHHHHLIN